MKLGLQQEIKKKYKKIFSENNIHFYKIPTDFKTISKIILHNIGRYIF